MRFGFGKAWTVLNLVIACAAIPQAASANLPYRLGLIAGEPSGWTSALEPFERLTLHASFGRTLGTKAEMAALVDAVMTFPEVLGPVDAKGRMIVWMGLGGRWSGLLERTRADRFGLRWPFGVSYVGDRGEVEVFFEIAPGVSLGHEQIASLDGGLGIRVGFK